jgi:hypothetical protein
MSQTTDRYSDGSYLESNPDWHQIDSPFKATNALSILDKHKVRFDSLVEVGCPSRVASPSSWGSVQRI